MFYHIPWRLPEEPGNREDAVPGDQESKLEEEDDRLTIAEWVMFSSVLFLSFVVSAIVLCGMVDLGKRFILWFVDFVF